MVAIKGQTNGLILTSCKPFTLLPWHWYAIRLYRCVDVFNIILVYPSQKRRHNENLHYIFDNMDAIRFKGDSARFNTTFFNPGVLIPGKEEHCVNTLKPGQNGRHFADDIFKSIFCNENVWISIKISLKFLPEGSINNIPALVQIMAWRRRGASHYLNQW